MEVFVKAQGHDIPLMVDPGDSVGAAKAMLGEKMGLSPSQLQLIHQGSTLGNESTLSSCNVGDGGTLQLAVARRAGKPAFVRARDDRVVAGSPQDDDGEITELALAPMGDDPLDPNSIGKKNVTSVLLETNDGQVSMV